jgi:RNase P subunit RPR2
MVSPLEFCPKCQGSCSTILTIGLRRTVRQEGSIGENLLFHIHCRSCNAYIRSYPMIADREELHPIELPQYAFFVEEQRIPA